MAGTQKNYPLWPKKEAQRLAKRLKKAQRHEAPGSVILETGFGPSGPPHMGTFGEIVRTAFVAEAIRKRGFEPAIIAFSDDMDGLRRVPSGFPESLEEHLGRPLSAIPDPFGTADSFSGHMNGKLHEMTALAQVEVDFRSASQEYRKGTFDEAIRIVLHKQQQVRNILASDLSGETMKDWFPFMVLCEQCGRIYSTRVLDFDAETAEAEYACTAAVGSNEGCGQHGTRSLLGGGGKFPWKIDWAARWFALEVDYELYGKDLIPSAEISDRICREIFEVAPPMHMFYELFLDESGAKISKSKGDVLSPTEWLKYAPRESLNLLFFDNPVQAKRVSLGRIPEYTRDLVAIEDVFYSDADDDQLTQNARETYRYLTFFEPSEDQPLRLDLGLLLNIIGGTGSADAEAVTEYLTRTGQYSADTLAEDAASDQIDRALEYYQSVARAGETEPESEAITEVERQALTAFADFLEGQEADDEVVQGEVFDLGKRFEIKAGRLFRLFYISLIRQERGPRLGGFVNVLGREAAAAKLRNAVERFAAAES
jgi:lysyl-tRNA synthetase class 1